MPLSFELLETIIVGFKNNDRFWSIAIILLIYHSYLEKWTISSIVSEIKSYISWNTVYMHGIWRNCGRDKESIIQKLIENVCHNKAFKEYNRVNSNYLVIKKNQGYKQFANIIESYSSALCLRVKLQYHISYNQWIIQWIFLQHLTLYFGFPI